MTDAPKKRISDETLEMIRKLDIKEFAENALGEKLKREGTAYMAYRNGGENNPSVAIVPSKHYWKDFTRDDIGGIEVLSYFAYRMWDTVELKGERFTTAVHQVCALAGIPLKYDDGTVIQPTTDRCVGEVDLVEDDGSEHKQSPEVLNDYYRGLLSLMHLTEGHRKHFEEERRIPIETVKIRSYASMSDNPQDRYKLARDVIKKLGKKPEGIPGFYLAQGEYGPYWTMLGREGIIVPFRNLFNQIWGLQLRLDDPDTIVTTGSIRAEKKGDLVELYDYGGQFLWSGKRSQLPVSVSGGSAELILGNRYRWFSKTKDLKRGVLRGATISMPTPAPYHVAVPSRLLECWEAGVHLAEVYDTETVWLGEGPLKGDIAADFTDQIHLQTASVSAMQSLFEPAMQLGAKTVILAPDADAQTKLENVGKTVINLVEAARDYFTPRRVQLKFATWSIEQSKGLDDLLNLGFRPNFLELN
ncbi:hypothetical protein [Cohnella phaseoli]|uniref:Toprim domain-containing protein n=1 Tax=Cohnella phaseoli TaxID=456490 RepID=A0A3D9JQ45_9BACL|nr:hypothetical protein [Cohnella phaseoli]RED76148.1 hypothetical protein DFP98_113209 [Cohnella phaseoli]